MIRVVYSHRLGELVRALCDALPPPGRLFDGPWLVVPSRPIELYLDLELARRRGISGNVDTLSLRGTFKRLCVSAAPDVVLIERAHLLGELLAILMERPGPGDEALAPVDDYLLGAGSAVDAVDRRRVEVARALASLFDDWELTRPERMMAWRARRDDGPSDGRRGADSDPEAADDERLLRALRRLWTSLFASDGRFARRGRDEGRRYLTLADFLDQRLDVAWSPPEAVHLFGLGELPRGLQRPLARLGDRTSLTIYAFNPCREFWEDLETGRRAPKAAPAPVKPSRRRRVSERQLALGLGPGLGLGPDEPRQGDGNNASADDTARVARASATVDDPVVAAAPDLDVENAGLALWGQAGRQAVRLLAELCDGDSDGRFGDGAHAVRPTLLQAIQADIVGREPRRTGERRLDLPSDGSLTFLVAPEARRELEAIAAQIWKLVGDDGDDDDDDDDDDDGDDDGDDDDDGRGTGDRRAAGNTATDGGDEPHPRRGRDGARRLPLRFCDIAVLIAGPDAPYLALAPSVFHEASGLPHTIVDAPLEASSRMTEAILGLLSLPLGPLTRREVLDVITHPNVRARFPEADPAVWLALCDALGIARGAARGAPEETYVDRDAFNWDQGLRRLALGRFAAGPRSGADEPMPMPVPLPAAAGGDAAAGADLLPAELADDFRGDADALALLVRSLLGDAAFARGARLTVPEWIRFVHALCDAYVVPTSPDDEAARLRIFAALDQLATAARPDTAVALSVAHDLIRDALAGLRGSRGHMFGNGVVVGSIESLRSIPFRVIFVVGLGPERFPSADRPRPLDPGGTPEPGDVTVRQRDRYAFLQTLLAAEEGLVLSTVGRDPATGDERDPSALLLELVDVVQSGYTRSGDWIRRVVADRDRDPLARAAFPIAVVTTPTATTASATAATATASTTMAPARAQRRAARPRVLRLADLRRFLECPLQGGARITLGLRHLDDDTDARDVTDEPFDVPRSLERALLGDLFTRAWTGPTPPTMDTLAAAYDRAVLRQHVARHLPAGLFAASVRRRHLDVLAFWRAAVETEAATSRPVSGPVTDVCIGRPDALTSAATSTVAASVPGSDAVPLGFDQREALRFRATAGDGETPIEIELRGRPAPQIRLGNEVGSLLLAVSPHPYDDLDSLRMFLDHVVLAASAPADVVPQSRRGIVLRPPRPGGSARPGISRFAFAPLAPARARAYLADLLADLFSRTHDYLLPCEAIFLHRKDREADLDLCGWVAKVRDDPSYHRFVTTAHGPVPEPFAYEIPAAAEASAMATRRFALMFELNESGRPSSKEEV